MNNKRINSEVNCEAYFSFGEVSSDYRIVSGKIRWSLCRNKKQTDKTQFMSSLHLPIVFGGARGEMVIVVGNGHGDTSSNPGRD